MNERNDYGLARSCPTAFLLLEEPCVELSGELRRPVNAELLLDDPLGSPAEAPAKLDITEELSDRRCEGAGIPRRAIPTWNWGLVERRSDGCRWR